MKSIRWSGLGIFIAVIALVIVVTHFFVDSWIKSGIESLAGKAVGAEVNVSDVHHSYSPFGVTVTGIQITDPAQPTHNTVQIASVAATVEFLPLLMRKIIIDELTVDKTEFNTLREKPGNVYAKQEPQADTASDTGLNIELPSVDDVLAKIPLQSEAAKKAVQQAYERHDAGLNEKFTQLPDEKSLNAYNEKLTALSKKDIKTPSDLKNAQSEFNAIKKELKAEKEKINNFRSSAKKAKQELSEKVAALKTASAEDYNKLKALLAGDMAALSDITQMVFGEQAKAWSERLFAAYELIVPMLESKKEEKKIQERAQGRWVEFSDESALPDFLVRKAKVSLLWQGQGFSSDWQDITTDHDMLGRATRFTVDSTNTELWKALKINGDFWLAEAGIKASQKWDLQEVLLGQLPLLADSVLNGSLQKASLNSTGSLNVTDGILDGNGIINLLEMVLQMEGTNSLTNQVAETLNALNSLTMDAGVRGVLDDPEFSLGSNLDKKIREAFASGAGAEGQQKLDELKQKLGAKTAAQLGEGNAKLASWDNLQNVAAGKNEEVEKMLKAKFESAIDKNKSKLEDELRKKLFN